MLDIAALPDVDDAALHRRRRSRASASRWACDEVILGLSGGVDSSVVAAALIHRAIGDQSHLRFRRPRPAAPRTRPAMVMDYVRRQPRRQGDPRRRRSGQFSASGRHRPEQQKRKIIGREFVEVFQAGEKLPAARWLAQGTIYPDVIESAGGAEREAYRSRATTTSAACPRR